MKSSVLRCLGIVDSFRNVIDWEKKSPELPLFVYTIQEQVT